MYKILFLPKWYPAEGDVQNGVFIRKHAMAAALNNEVVVLYAQPSRKRNTIEEIKERNLTEIIIYYQSSFFKPLSILLYSVAIFKGWKRIRRSGFFPDLCHVHVLNRPALLALWLKWRYRVPFIISEHWSGYITGEFEHRGLLTSLFTAAAIKKAALVTVVSETLKSGMMRCGLKADYHILPNVVEVLPDVWTQNPPTDRFRYLIVADLRDEIKNITGVIKAFHAVHQSESQTELIIAGDGEDRMKLEKLSKELNLQDACHFKGRLSNEDVLRLIPFAHVIIINSRIETFSVVALESVFSGRPVISTRCGGPKQFINEQNGILIEKDNDGQLAEAMRQIKINYSNYPVEKVRNSIPNNYKLEDIADILSNYYNDVIKQNSSFVIRNS